jgi:hypothetical protein
MSSTERAPEPTMEEILASIRRIITDDEAGQASAEKPAQKAQAEDESLEGEADNQIIDDIARVLSGGGEAPASEEEEILDLTAGTRRTSVCSVWASRQKVYCGKSGNCASLSRSDHRFCRA